MGFLKSENLDLESYDRLADAALSEALSLGLGPGKEISITLSHTDRNTNKPSYSELVVSYIRPTRYYRGMQWLCGLPGSADYRLFFLCISNPPDAPLYVNVLNEQWLFHPEVQLSQVDALANVVLAKELELEGLENNPNVPAAGNSGAGSTLDSVTNTTGLQFPIGTVLYSNGVGTVGSAQDLPVGAAIGARAARLSKSFQTPIHVPSNRFLNVILRMPVGTATASQIVAGMINFEGYFD